MAEQQNALAQSLSTGEPETAVVLLASRYDADGDNQISSVEFIALVSDLICLRDEVLYTAPAEAAAAAANIAREGFSGPVIGDTIDFVKFIELATRWSAVLEDPRVAISLRGATQLRDLHDPSLIPLLDDLEERRAVAGGGGQAVWVYADQGCASLLAGQRIPDDALNERHGWHFNDHGEGEGVIYWWPPRSERAADAMLIAHPVCLAQNLTGPKLPVPIMPVPIMPDPGPWSPRPVEPIVNDDVYARIEQRLRAEGYVSKELGGGGDCFFRVLAYAVYGNAGMHSWVRNEVVQELRKLSPVWFPDEEGGKDGYCNRMALQGEYCQGELEMRGACLALDVNLIVKGLTEEDDRTLSFSPSATRTCILVHYKFGNENDHFRGVESLHDAH